MSCGVLGNCFRPIFRVIVFICYTCTLWFVVLDPGFTLLFLALDYLSCFLFSSTSPRLNGLPSLSDWVIELVILLSMKDFSRAQLLLVSNSGLRHYRLSLQA